jgi:hypothetical protein
MQVEDLSSMYENRYTHPAVGFPWSNDWDDWPLLEDLFAKPSPRIELLKDSYGLFGTIEPLVHAPGAPN